ncbi:hypothetical protein ACNOYE_31580 [Nannocystaceae bacterium ST9]
MSAPALSVPEHGSLAEVFGFTSEQLASNREGRLGEGQTAPLWTAVAWSVPTSLLALLLGIAAIKYARGVLRVVGPLLGTLAALAIGGLLAYPSLRDLFEPRVALVEGPVSDQSGAGKGPGQAVLHIGDQRLLTRGETMAAAAVIVRGEVYRAYYLPNTKRLLSIEAAPGGSP